MSFWPKKFSRNNVDKSNDVAMISHQEVTGLTQSNFNSETLVNDFNAAPNNNSDQAFAQPKSMTNTFASASDTFSKAVDHNIHPEVSYNLASEEQNAGSHQIADAFEPTSSSETHSSILNTDSIDSNMRLSQAESVAANSFPHQINLSGKHEPVTSSESTHDQHSASETAHQVSNEFEHSPMSSQDFPVTNVFQEGSKQLGSYDQSETVATKLNLPVKNHVEFTRPEQNSPPSLNTTGNSSDPFTRAAVHGPATLPSS